MYGWLTGEKKYGDKGRDGACSRTISCLTFHKSHPHKYPYMCGVFIISNPITTTFTSLSQNTTCRDIYVGVTCGQLDMRLFLNMLHPYPCPILFSPVSHPYISLIFKVNYSSVGGARRRHTVVVVCLCVCVCVGVTLFRWFLDKR